MAAKSALLLCTTTGYQTQAFVEAAEKLGLELRFGTDRCHRLEDPWRDGALALRFHQPDVSARIIMEADRPDAIIAVGDAPTVTAALACRELGLPFHTPEGAAICRDKFRFRQVLCSAGLPVPFFTRLRLNDPPEPPAGFPCVLKPGSMSASRGVIRANNVEEFRAAFERIAALIRSPEIQVKREEITGQIVVEGYIAGREFALEGLMDRGRLIPLALFDKPDPLEGPYFEETIYVTPSRLPADKQEAIVEAVEKANAAVGLYHGPIHAEARLNENGPWVLEIAARPIGGLCARALRFGGGISLEELIFRHALGQDIHGLSREEEAAGVMMIPIPQRGVYTGVEGLDAARNTPGIEDLVITAKPGQKLIPWPEGSSYLGFIFSRAAKPQPAEQALREAHSRLTFLIAPNLNVF